MDRRQPFPDALLKRYDRRSIASKRLRMGWGSAASRRYERVDHGWAAGS